MKLHFLLTTLLFAFTPALQAWNDKGHMVIARLAWKELTEAERAKVVAILQKHPHYQEFLSEKKPDGFTTEEWVFLRAATWSDWIRGGSKERQKYHMGPAHYINLALVYPGYTGAISPPAQQNILTQLANSKLIARNGNQEDRAVHLCWLFHLVGDIHQPLHCTNFYSSRFPKGDRGGNLARAKLHNRGSIQLHSFWDDLLGSGTSVSSIGNSVLEIETYYQEKKEQIDAELKKHPKPDDWAKEGYEFARKYAYLDGKFHPANEDDKPKEADLPVLPEDYAPTAGKAARYAVIKAGKRLAAELREVLASK
jgi:hypothetical protein